MAVARQLAQMSPEELLRSASRRLPPWVMALLAIAIAWQLARLTWLAVAGPTLPAPPVSPGLPGIPTGSATAAPSIDVDSIIAAHLFGEADENAPPPVTEQPVDVPETRLNLELRGIVSSGDPDDGIAIIADAGRDEKVYEVGDRLPGGATVHAVYSDRVILNRAGILENLRLPKEFPQGTRITTRSTPARPAGAAPRPNGSIRDVISNNAGRITDILRVQPFMDGGQMRGYRVYPGRNRAQFAALGLRPGDLVTEIDGMPLTDPAAGLEIFGQLGDAMQVSVTVERDGVPEVLTLDTSQLNTLAEEE
jgi:general secretion pathway protein C